MYLRIRIIFSESVSLFLSSPLVFLLKDGTQDEPSAEVSLESHMPPPLSSFYSLLHILFFLNGVHRF